MEENKKRPNENDKGERKGKEPPSIYIYKCKYDLLREGGKQNNNNKDRTRTTREKEKTKPNPNPNPKRKRKTHLQIRPNSLPTPNNIRNDPRALPKREHHHPRFGELGEDVDRVVEVG